MAARDVITKANLQYYDGKLKQEIAKKGDVKEIRFHGKSTEIDNYHYSEDSGIYWFNSNDSDLLKRYNGNDGAIWGYNNAIYTDSTGDTHDRDSISINYERDTGINKLHISFGRYGINDDTAYVYHDRVYKIPLKDDVDSLFATASGHKFKEVSTTQFPTIETFLDLQSTNWDATGEGYMVHADRREDTIYLYPKTENGVRYFDEYLYEPGEPPAGPTDSGVPASFEFLGTLKQDLSGYVKEEDIPETDSDYIEGMFIRNLEPGLYDSSYNQLANWNTLIGVSGSTEYITFSSTQIASVDTAINTDFPTGTLLVLNDTTQVGSNALMYIMALERVYIRTTDVPGYGAAFQNCSNLRAVYYKGSTVIDDGYYKLPASAKVYAI